MTWQTIDNAPKDGTIIMLYCPSLSITKYPTIGVNHGDGWELAFDDCLEEIFPTHWMPLPLPPEI